MTNSDDALAQQVLSGSNQAFDLFVARYLERVRHEVRSVLHDDDESQAVAIDAFTNVNNYIRSGRGGNIQNLVVFTLTTARNLARNHLRDRRHERALEPLEREGDEDNTPIQRISTEAGPDAQVIAALMQQRILSAYRAACSEEVDFVILARTVQGYSHEEIAATLGMKRVTVSSRAMRSRRRFLAHLVECETDLVGGSVGVARSFHRAVHEDVVIPRSPLDALFRCFTVRVAEELAGHRSALASATVEPLFDLFVQGVARTLDGGLAEADITWMAEGFIAIGAASELQVLPPDRLNVLFDAFCSTVVAVGARCSEPSALHSQPAGDHKTLWRSRFDEQIARGRTERSKRDRSASSRKPRLYPKEQLEEACWLIAPHLYHQLETVVHYVA